MTIFDHFDAIRIVNLAQRTDRRRAMNRELARVGLAGDPRVAFFSAIRPADAGRFTSIGARGVYLSQKHLLREAAAARHSRSEEHTSELQSLMRISYAVFCLKQKKNNNHTTPLNHH